MSSRQLLAHLVAFLSISPDSFSSLEHSFGVTEYGIYQAAVLKTPNKLICSLFHHHHFGQYPSLFCVEIYLIRPPIGVVRHTPHSKLEIPRVNSVHLFHLFTANYSRFSHSFGNFWTSKSTDFSHIPLPSGSEFLLGKRTG